MTRPARRPARPARKTAPRIRALFLDVDGVLTDGRIYLSDDGNDFKVFDTKDGHGIKRAILGGIEVAWISGRSSRATARRARELGVRFCRQGVPHDGKLAVYRELCRRLGISAAETAAMGDDEPDLPMMRPAAVSACPADAVPMVRREAKIVLRNAGGHGAVREFIDILLEKNAR